MTPHKTYYREDWLTGLDKKSKARIKNYERTQYNGISYHSKKEAGYAMNLDWRIKAGEIKEWTGQCKISLRGVNGSHITNYYVDFKVITVHNEVEYHEVKGFETEIWRLKWKMFMQQMAVDEPDAKLIVFK